MQTAYKIVFDSLTVLTLTTGFVGLTTTAQAAKPLNLSAINSLENNSISLKSNRGSGRVKAWVSVELAEIEDDRGSGRFATSSKFIPSPHNTERTTSGSPIGYRGTGR